MGNSELKKKLKKVGKFIFIFFLVYLIIGFFLNSNYPIMQYPFDFSKAYEVLRDGLTLSAYFLAPLIAVVLFNDWRAEYGVTNTLQLLDDVVNLSLGIKNGLGFYNAKIIKEKEVAADEFRNRDDRQSLLWQLKTLERLNSKFLIKNQEIKTFKDLQIQFKELADRALNDLHMMEYFQFKLASDNHRGYIESYYQEYTKYSQQFEEVFKELDKLEKQIELEVSNAQDSILGG